MVSDPNVSKKGEKRRQRNISILPWISARFSRMSMCKMNNDIRRPGGEIIQHTDADIKNAFQPEMRLFNIEEFEKKKRELILLDHAECGRKEKR